MLITIINGNDLNYVLARIFLLLQHTVNVIEHEDEVRINKLKTLGVHVIQGEGTDMNILSQPCIAASDMIIALMDREDDNLASCLYLKRNCRCVSKTIAKVNNPKYIQTFEKLGIDVAFDGAALVSGLPDRRETL